MVKTCTRCGIELSDLQRHPNKKYCSTECLKEDYSGFYSVKSGLATATVGAISEYIVGIDLLRRGYEVFRAFSPACSCDMLATKGVFRTTFEIRTGYVSKVGTLCYPKGHFRADRFAVYVERLNKIFYIPELPEDESKTPNA